MLSALQLSHFRCFEALRIDFDPGFNFIVGANGEGKTSLLEAACVLLRLQSQRSSSLAPLIRVGSKSFAIRGRIDAHDLEFRYGGLRRTVKFDDVEQRSHEEYLHVARVVSFANTDIEMVRGSSEARRRYLDFIGAQILRTYRPTLRSYERALRSRNALLKQPSPNRRAVSAYDQPLVEHGLKLSAMRREIVRKICPEAAASHRKISHGLEVLSVEFLPGNADDFAAQLAESAADETRLRQTVVGPHRDDVGFRVEEMPAASFASEGQQRTVVLALKMAQAQLFAREHETAPLLLIDDVFGELDPQRRNALVDAFPGDSQKLITATSLAWREELPAGALFRLCDHTATRA